MARLKGMDVNETDRLNAAADVLDQATEDKEDSFTVEFGQFYAEQLRLCTTPAKRRRYSPMLLSAAMVWQRTSPKLYEDLRNCGLLILPHRVTLRRLTSALSVKEGLEIGTLKYLKMRVNKLSQLERVVDIAMDEVYSARAVELAGGRIFGDYEDGVSNTILCTQINSVGGNYQELVTMSPVTHITAEKMKDIFFKVPQLPHRTRIQSGICYHRRPPHKLELLPTSV